MKRIVSFLLMLIVLFIGIEFLVIKLTKEYVVSYTIFNDNKEVKINEKYQSDFGNIYDLELNIDDNKFLYIVDNSFNKQKRIVSNILYYEDNNDICIYPVLKNDTGTYIECIRDNILYTKDSFPNKNLIGVVENDLKEKGYVRKEKPDDIRNYGTSNVYLNNLSSNDIIILWQYKSIQLLNKENYQTIGVLNFDVYDNRLGILVNNYYLVPDFASDKYLEFDKVKLYNVVTGRDDEIKLKYALSSKTYISGVVNKKVYYTDPVNLLQIEVNPEAKTSRLIGSVDLGGQMYEDGKWKDRNIYDFKKEIKYTEDLGDIKNYNYEYLDFSNSSYYFYDSNGNVYQVLKNHVDKKILLFTASNLKNFNVVGNDLYYTIGDTLYHYNTSGNHKILVNKDLVYNSNNRISVYRNK